MTKPKTSTVVGDASSNTQTVRIAVSVDPVGSNYDTEDQSTSTGGRGGGGRPKQRSRGSISSKKPKRLNNSGAKGIKKGKYGARKSGEGMSAKNIKASQTLKITVKSFLAEFSCMDMLEGFVRKDTEKTWLEFLTESKVPVTDPAKYLMKTAKSVEKMTERISLTLSKYAQSCRHLNVVIITPESPYPFHVKEEEELEEINVDEGSSDVQEFNYEAFVVANNREVEFQKNQWRQKEAEADSEENADGDEEGDVEISDDQDDYENNEEDQDDTNESGSGSDSTPSIASPALNPHQSPLLRVEEQAPERINVASGSQDHNIANVVHSVPQMYRNVSIVQGRQGGDSNPQRLGSQNLVLNPGNPLTWAREREISGNLSQAQQVQQHVYAHSSQVPGNAYPLQQPIHVQTNFVPVASTEVSRGEFGDLVRDHVVRAFQSMPSEDILRVRDELVALRTDNRLYAWSRHAPMTGFAILNAFHV